MVGAGLVFIEAMVSETDGFILAVVCIAVVLIAMVVIAMILVTVILVAMILIAVVPITMGDRARGNLVTHQAIAD